MSNDQVRVNIYTTASDEFDLDGTTCLNYKVGQTATGRGVRLVSVTQESLLRQQGLYASNLEAVFSEHDWKCEQQFGNVTSFATEDVA